MVIRVVLELLNVDVLFIAIRVTVGKRHANVWVLVERLGLFFCHFHPLSFHASVVVTNQLVEYCATNDEEPIVCDTFSTLERTSSYPVAMVYRIRDSIPHRT